MLKRYFKNSDLGKQVTFWTNSRAYRGTLIDIEDVSVVLKDVTVTNKIATVPPPQQSEQLNGTWRILFTIIECFGDMS